MRNPHGHDEVFAYIASLFAPEDSALSSARMGIAQARQGMQLGPVESKMLQLFIQMAGVKSIVEVGTCLGVSAVWMAEALPADGVLYTLERDAALAEKAKTTLANAKLAAKTHVLVGDAREQLETLNANGPFDMVFIDADKAGYPAYLDWAEKHVRKGGLIVGDNTLLFGAVHLDECPEGTSKKSWEAMRQFNARLADPLKYNSILIPTPEGMTVAIKHF